MTDLVDEVTALVNELNCHSGETWVGHPVDGVPACYCKIGKVYVWVSYTENIFAPFTSIAGAVQAEDLQGVEAHIRNPSSGKFGQGMSPAAAIQDLETKLREESHLLSNLIYAVSWS